MYWKKFIIKLLSLKNLLLVLALLKQRLKKMIVFRKFIKEEWLLKNILKTWKWIKLKLLTWSKKGKRKKKNQKNKCQKKLFKMIRFLNRVKVQILIKNRKWAPRKLNLLKKRKRLLKKLFKKIVEELQKPKSEKVNIFYYKWIKIYYRK